MPTLAVTSRGGIGLVYYETEGNKSTWRLVSRADSKPMDAVASDWQPAWPNAMTLQSNISPPSTT